MTTVGAPVRGRMVWRAGVLVVLALAGTLFVASARVAQGSDTRTSQRVSTIGVLTRAQQQLGELSARVRTLRAEIDAMAATQSSSSSALAAARAKVAALSAPAGLTAVTGPAVTVTLDDAPTPPPGQPYPPGLNADSYVVHQQDVQAVVNALWAGGAEAMALMDQRVISTSAVRCVGLLLLLQGRSYPPPYTITAIGDPTRLLAALDASAAVTNYKEYVPLIGLGYRVKVSTRVTVPGFTGVPDLSYASEPS